MPSVVRQGKPTKRQVSGERRRIGPVKEFAVYTLLRLGLLVGAFAIVVGIWSLFADGVPLLWAAVVAFLVSGVISLFMLNKPREAFAAKVQARAAKVTQAVEAQRSKEDID